MTQKIGLAIALAAVVALSACNMVDGAGKGLESASTAISDASGENGKK